MTTDTMLVADGQSQARINSTITKLCSSIAPSNTDPTLTGTGLYTHAVRSTKAAKGSRWGFTDKTGRQVDLLPIGGPNRYQPTKFQQELDREVAAVYQELQDAVEAEEKLSGEHKSAANQTKRALGDVPEPSINALKVKYGSLYATQLDDAMSGLVIGDGAKRRHSDVVGETTNAPKQRKRVSFALEAEPRQRSAGDVSATGRDDEAMRRGSGSRNEYNIDRDPRRRGR